MSVILKPAKVKIRKSDGQYSAVGNAIAEKKTEEYLKEIEEKGNSVKESIPDLPKDIDRIKEDIVEGNVATKVTKSVNLYSKEAATVGGYIGDNGLVVENAQFSYSDFIEIDKTKKYAIYEIFGINIAGAFYDKNKQFLGLIYKSSISNGIIDFSTFNARSYYNAIKYVRLNQTKNDMDSAMFIADVSSYPTEYIPYTESLYEVVGNLKKAIDELFAAFGLKQGYLLVNEALSNVAFGKNAMKNASTDNGAYNVAIGDEALTNNTGTGSDDTGNYNVAIGYKAMQANTTGNHNTAVGFQALPVNTTGVGNTAIGEDACLGNTTGKGNTDIGRYSLFSNKEGGDNVAIGLHSLRNCLGNMNTAIGQSSGVSCKGNNNIFLGYYSNANENVENSIVLGQENYCHESNMMDVGSGFIEKVVLSTKTGKKLISFNADGTVTWSKYTPPSN